MAETAKGGEAMISIPRCPLCGTLMLDGSVNTMDDVHVHLTLKICPACYCELLADVDIPEAEKDRVVSELGVYRYWQEIKNRKEAMA